MTVKVIKEAFVEGRETTTEWDQSQAKKNQIKLDTFNDNIDNFNGRIFRSTMPLEQICPDTGKVLRTFSSRLDAARWIVQHVLKLKSDPGDGKAVSLTGNMQICMASGWKSYGYYWRAINTLDHQDRVIKAAKELGGTPVMVFDTNTHVTKVSQYASVREAAMVTGVSPRQVQRLLADGSPGYKGFSFRSMNLKATQKKFADLNEAAQFFGVPEHFVQKCILKEQPINNIKVQLDTDSVINVYQGRKIVQTHPTLTAAAAALGTNRHVLRRALNSVKLVGGLYRVARGAVTPPAPRQVRGKNDPRGVYHIYDGRKLIASSTAYTPIAKSLGVSPNRLKAAIVAGDKINGYKIIKATK